MDIMRDPAPIVAGVNVEGDVAVVAGLLELFRDSSVRHASGDQDLAPDLADLMDQLTAATPQGFVRANGARFSYASPAD